MLLKLQSSLVFVRHRTSIVDTIEIEQNTHQGDAMRVVTTGNSSQCNVTNAATHSGTSHHANVRNVVNRSNPQTTNSNLARWFTAVLNVKVNITALIQKAIYLLASNLAESVAI